MINLSRLHSSLHMVKNTQMKPLFMKYSLRKNLEVNDVSGILKLLALQQKKILVW